MYNAIQYWHLHDNMTMSFINCTVHCFTVPLLLPGHIVYIKLTLPRHYNAVPVLLSEHCTVTLYIIYIIQYITVLASDKIPDGLYYNDFLLNVRNIVYINTT